MNKLLSLIKRNIKIFFSTKSSIFFSSIALIILVVLHFLVFRSQNADILLNIVMDIDEKWAYWFSDSLMLSSLIPIAGITIAITTLSQIVSDKDNEIINDLYVSPISKNTLLFSYLLSSVVISLLFMSLYIVFLVGFYYFMYGLLFSANQFLSIVGLMFLSVLLGNLFVLIIVSFIKKEKGMVAVGTILGTLIGFVCGAYVPVGLLGDSIAKAFTVLPFLPLTAMSKQAFFMNAAQTDIPEEILNGKLAEIYGYELFFNGEQLSTFMLLTIVAIYIVVFSIFNVIRFMKMRNKD